VSENKISLRKWSDGTAHLRTLEGALLTGQAYYWHSLSFEKRNIACCFYGLLWNFVNLNLSCANQ